PLADKFLVDTDHGQLDHVRSRALDRRIDSVPFCKTANREIGRIDILEPAFTAHQGFHIAVLPGKIDRIIHIPLNAGELGLVIIDDLLYLRPADTQIVRQTESALSVDDPEIDAFRLVAHLFGDVFFFYAEDP